MTHSPLTASDLDALTDLVSRASLGPWEANGCAIYSRCTPSGRLKVGVVLDGSHRPRADHDASAIAAVMTYAPALIALARKALAAPESPR